MKYLLIFIAFTVLFSCETEDPIQSIKGKYVLQSYTQVDCNGRVGDFVWKGAESSEEEFSIDGSLNISLFSIFTQNLKLVSDDTNLHFEIKFAGALTHIEGDDWKAEFSESPFEDGDCQTAYLTAHSDSLVWSFIDTEGCEIIMVWRRS